MANINFIETYMPAYADLPATDVADTRRRLQNFITSGFPEVEMGPNTVVGDLILTPMAYTVTALETGMDHFMSDLDLANVAEDVIYNCDFVEAYLKNFNVSPEENLQPSGVVRLAFSTNEHQYLDRSIRFSFNEAVFQIYFATNATSFEIFPVGTAIPAGADGAVLIDSGSDAYFADIPVVGVSGVVEVPASTPGLINTIAYSTLGAITALTDFDSGAVTKTLPQLASDTRKTVYAASLNTRNGAIQYVFSVCPFAEGAYAIISGDKEMLRAYDSSTTAVTNCLDLYARSKSYAFEEIQSLKLTRKGSVYEGAFDYVGQPYYIEDVSITSVSNPISYEIIADTKADTPAPLPFVSYTPHETLTLRVKASKEVDATADVDNTGKVYILVQVTYKTDPMLRAIANTVESADNKPVNMTVMTRSFIPIIISRFEVQYVKKPGVQVLLGEADLRIRDYLDKLGAPDAFAEGQISKIMEEAGAKYVRSIGVRAKVQWSVADKYKEGGDEVPFKDGPYIANASGLRISYTDSEHTPPKYACSIRNVRYYLEEGALTFSEVKDI